jgi:hypothetical protein
MARRRLIDDEPGLEHHRRGLHRILARRHGRLRDQRRGLAGWEFPDDGQLVLQDVDGDGLETRDKTDDLVSAELREPNEESVLGGAGSDWLRDGGPAEMQSRSLRVRWKGVQESGARFYRVPGGRLSQRMDDAAASTKPITTAKTTAIAAIDTQRGTRLMTSP